MTDNFGDTTATARQFRPVGDFYNPVYTITFIAPDVESLMSPESTDSAGRFDDVSAAEAEANLDKALATSNKIQLTLDQAILDNYATSISLDCAGQGPLKCRVVLSPPRDEGIAILSSGMIQYNSYMKIEWGYPGLLSKPNYFVLIQPHAEFTERDSTITLVGVDIFSTNLMRQSSLTRYDRSDDKNKTDLLILEDLANTYKLTLVQDSNLTAVTNIGTFTPLPLNNPGNDWELFKYICQLHKVMFTIEGDSIIRLTPWISVVKQESKYTLGFNRQPDSNTEFPIKSIRINTISSAFFTPSSNNIKSNQVDIDSGIVTNENKEANTLNDLYAVGDPKSDGTVTGNVNSPDAPLQDGTTLNVSPGFGTVPLNGTVGHSISHPSGEGNIKGKDESILIGTSLVTNMRASVTTLGHPDLLPPTCVTVEGMGPLGGSYFILNAQHNLGSDGYEVTLELVRTLTPKVLGGTNKQQNTIPEQSPPQNSPSPVGPNETPS